MIEWEDYDELFGKKAKGKEESSVKVIAAAKSSKQGEAEESVNV